MNRIDQGSVPFPTVFDPLSRMTQTQKEQQLEKENEELCLKIAELRLALKLQRWHANGQDPSRNKPCTCGRIVSERFTRCRLCFRNMWPYEQRVEFARTKYRQKFVSCYHIRSSSSKMNFEDE